MSGDDMELRKLSSKLAELAEHCGGIAAAESCTGGWIAKAMTDIPGSSAWFGYGFVTYSNEAKTRMLRVPGQLFEAHGAVSGPVVRAMVEGARTIAGADFAVATSGIAGPGGATATKPAGLVWFGWGSPTEMRTEQRQFSGDRTAVRRAATAYALQGLIDMLGGRPRSPE